MIHLNTKKDRNKILLKIKNDSEKKLKMSLENLTKSLCKITLKKGRKEKY